MDIDALSRQLDEPMTPILLALAGFADEAAVTAAMARARLRTVAAIPCQSGAQGEEIVVCALRRADRYRVPILTPRAEGDPAIVDALGERERLLQVPGLPCGVGAFLQRCGMAGVTVSTRNGLRPERVRPLAK